MAQTNTAATALPRKKHFRGRKAKDNIAGFIFIAPAMLGLIVFMVIPAIIALSISFYDWDLLTEKEFVGFANYKKLFQDELFWNSIKVTLQYIVYHIPASMLLAFFMAVALKQKVKGIGLFRTAFVMPWITTPILISFIWRWILDPNFGVLNYITKLFGYDTTAMVSTSWFPMMSIAVINMWIYCGYHMMVFTAGLGNIPESLYEAARIDGANAVQRAFKITVPLMKPTIMFVLITSIIGSFQIFDLAYGLYGGGPGDATRVYYFYIYENAFKYFKMGYASALSIVLFIILIICTLVQYFLFQRDMVTDYSS